MGIWGESSEIELSGGGASDGMNGVGESSEFVGVGEKREVEILAEIESIDFECEFVKEGVFDDRFGGGVEDIKVVESEEEIEGIGVFLEGNARLIDGGFHGGEDGFHGGIEYKDGDERPLGGIESVRGSRHELDRERVVGGRDEIRSDGKKEEAEVREVGEIIG